MTPLELFGLIGAAIGLQILLAMAVAIQRRNRTSAARNVLDLSEGAKDAAWVGLRDFRVAARTSEDQANTQCSFTLVPCDTLPLLHFKPGQFLTLSLAVDGPEPWGRTVRCYSISDTPHSDHYRITVKRALAPPTKPALPAGIASGWLHDQAQTGTVLQIRAPSGQFVFARDARAPPVFIAGGIGITPILTMLKSALGQDRDGAAHLFYGVRDGRDHAFRAELAQLVLDHPGLERHVLYAEPTADDVRGADYDDKGFISLDLLKATLPHGRHAFYICGPDRMMKALIPALRSWGVDDADIHRESFGPQTAAPKLLLSSLPGPALAIGFRRSGRTIDWTGQDANLLDFAERQSITVDAGCRSGNCGTCETRLLSGQVHYAARPDFDVSPGHCLLCVATPETALELDA